MSSLHNKKTLHSLCQSQLAEKISDIKNQISELNQSFADEGKSSAGDKHETARAMAQLEVEKLHQQLHLTEIQLNVLNKLNPDSHSETIQSGSIVKTDKGIFYIAVPLGKVVSTELNNQEVMVISAASPLGKEMIGKKTGGEVVFNKTSYKIEVVD